MKLALLILSVLLLGCRLSLAGQDERFVEFSGALALHHRPTADQTYIYDLGTVHVMQPGRFTLVQTVIDDAGRMAFELKVLDTLRTYCRRPDGKYPPPSDVFRLGPPDLPVESIEVKTSGKWPFKTASWHYPYKRLAIEESNGTFSQVALYLHCKGGHQDEQDEYLKRRARITNGTRYRQLFDCKRGIYDMEGVPFVDDEEPSPEEIQKSMFPDPVPPPNTSGYRVYRDICLRVTDEEPYSPE